MSCIQQQQPHLSIPYLILRYLFTRSSSGVHVVFRDDIPRHDGRDVLRDLPRGLLLRHHRALRGHGALRGGQVLGRRRVRMLVVRCRHLRGLDGRHHLHQLRRREVFRGDGEQRLHQLRHGDLQLGDGGDGKTFWFYIIITKIFMFFTANKFFIYRLSLFNYLFFVIGFIIWLI